MDFKVYTKEEVKQPDGNEYYYVPNIIDIEPQIELDENNNEVLTGCTVFEDDKNLIEQECALATIWQRGLDPVSPEVGIRWSEVILGEVNVVQLMEDIREAVANITLNIVVIFDAVTAKDGTSLLQYTLQAVV